MKIFDNHLLRKRIKTDIDSINRSLERISKGSITKPYAQGNPYATIALILHEMAYNYIALQEYKNAIGTLYSSSRVSAWLYEKHLAGCDINPQNLSAGHWQYLITSLLTNDWALIKIFSNNYNIVASKSNSFYAHTADSQFIGRYLSALINDNCNEIDVIHKVERPSLDRRFRGIYEILDVISYKNYDQFIKILIKGSELWEDYMKKHKDEVYSICYLNGACFVKLAERIFNEKIDIEIPQFPKQLLEIESYTPYPLPEMIFK